MKNLFFGFLGILIGISCFYFYQQSNSPFQGLIKDSPDSPYQMHVKIEKAPSPWADFVFNGPQEEAPEGIERIALTGKWIRPIEKPQEGYVLAYKAEVALKKHTKDKIRRLDGHEWIIKYYLLSFDFFLLDEDGFCLRTIKTSNDKLQIFPSFAVLISPGKGIVQYTLLLETIPEELVMRIKKIVFLPKFEASSLRIKPPGTSKDNPKHVNAETKDKLILEEKTRLLLKWQRKIEELPPSNELDVLDLVTFKAFGGTKTIDELNAKAEEMAKKNLGLMDFDFNEPFGDAAPF